MSGIKGRKLPDRTSKSKRFHSIRSLVFSLFDKNKEIAKEKMVKIMMKEYPGSKFNDGHFAWYKHTWNKIQLEKAGYSPK